MCFLPRSLGHWYRQSLHRLSAETKSVSKTNRVSSFFKATFASPLIPDTRICLRFRIALPLDYHRFETQTPMVGLSGTRNALETAKKVWRENSPSQFIPRGQFGTAHSADNATTATPNPTARLSLSLIAKTTGSWCISPREASNHTRLSQKIKNGTISHNRVGCR